MANTIHDTSRLEAARDQLLYAANLLQTVIDGQTSQTNAGAKLGMTPQDINRQLQFQFQPYIKKNFHEIATPDLCDALKKFRTPADRFMLEIFEDMLSKDPSIIDILPEYDEDSLWTVAEETLNAIQLAVVKLVTGQETGEPMPIKTIAERLQVSEVYIRGVRKRAMLKMRRSHIIEKIIPNEAFRLIELTQQIMKTTAKIVNDYEAAKTSYEQAHPLTLATQAFLEDKLPDENIRKELGLVLTNEVETAVRAIPIVIPIKSAGFSERAANCLRRANVETLNQLAEMPLLNIMKIRNSGKKTREEFYYIIKERLGIERPELLEK